MKLRRLILGRYGHLSDVVLEFPEAPGLHVVLGANEAGKSTALTAIGDCLFGFPHRTPYAFLHATRDLRIGATLQARDGRQATFVRRKGRKEDLFDDQDQPQPGSAIAAFLVGATRERFDRVFGLNGSELRQGGDAILQGHGEVGEAILGAHTGLFGFRAKVDALEAEAGKLFGDRRGRRAFHEAADRFNRARHDVAERRVEPAAWKLARDDLDALEADRVAAEQRAAALHAERSRLDRIRRTTSARLALSRALGDSAALGEVPALPSDAAQQYQAAVAARDQALRDLAREQARIEGLDAELAGLADSPPVLTLAQAIDALAEDRKPVAIAVRDRETQRLLADQRAAAMTEEGRRLGLDLDADALAVRIPSALDRENVNQALRRHARLSGQQTAATEGLAAADGKLAELRTALEALPPLEPTADSRQAIETVKGFGPLDDQLTEAASAVQAASDDLAAALVGLPLWHQGAEALALTPMPLDAEVQRLTEALTVAADGVRLIETRLAVHDRALAEYAAQALADAAAGALPTAEAIEAVRTRRDAAWVLIRRVYVDGGAVASPEEMRALAVDATLPKAFQGLIEAADRLADRRAAEQERVVAVEQRRAATVRQQALRDGDERLRIEAVARLADAAATWQALWQPARIVAGDPASMREWLHKRAGVLAAHRRLQDAERKLDAVRVRHAAGLAALQAALPAETLGATLAARLLTADRVCRAREKHADRLAKAHEAMEAATEERAKASRVMARLETDLAGWRTTWAAVAQSLSLPADASPDLGTVALGLWDAIDKAGRQRRDAMDRVGEMTAAIDRFGAETAMVVGQVAAELAGVAPLEAVVRLMADLAAARVSVRRRDELNLNRNQMKASIAGFERQRNAALDVLAGLRAQAGVADGAALDEAIQRWLQQRTLAEQIAARQAELLGLDDGKTLAELAIEAEGVDFDTLSARIQAIETELHGINGQALANQERMVGLRQTLAEMERGRDAAGAAQEMETALADIDDIAGRYVTLRIAHELLRAGIERFRRQQQGPLLARAGQIFARLTEGRYDRLGLDEEDGKTVVTACRPDGSECQADRLSEGTLDQLYLALRLAALESDALMTEPLPFIGDDLLVNFDDRRAKAAIRVLADFASVTQVILFTHHGHIAEMAAGLASVHRLAADLAVV
jgi:chromosome segregation protein